jgi:molybdate transport system ATP-binding protein
LFFRHLRLSHPRLLLLDELSALDDELKHGIIADMKRWLHENAVPVLFVTDNRSEARIFADRVLLLKSGKIAGEGDVQAVAVSQPGWVA